VRNQALRFLRAVSFFVAVNFGLSATRPEQLRESHPQNYFSTIAAIEFFVRVVEVTFVPCSSSSIRSFFS
jgi:hypothetical protein